MEMSFEVPWEELLPFRKKAVEKLGQDLEISGFRPGNIPEEIAEKKLGESKILAEAAKMLIKEKYPQYVQENKMEVIGNPKIEIEKLAPNNEMIFKVEAETMPEVKLPDYKEICSKIKKEEKPPLEEKEVENTLKQIQHSRSKFKEVQRPSQKGDFLELSYQSPQLENNRVFEDAFLLGRGHFIPGFEEKLKETKPGEEKELNVKFPENFQKKEWAGKECNLKVKIKKVKEAEIPELNDSFAKTLGKFNNLEELKKNIREGMNQEKEKQMRQKTRSQILEKLKGKSEMEIPQSLLEMEYQNALANLKESINQQLKTSFEEYLQKIKKTKEEMEKTLREQAKRRVEEFLILREIGRREDIKVEKEEVEKALNMFLNNFSEKKNDLDLQRIRDYYKGVIYNEKVFQKLESFLCR